jgi:hypothetical protein
MRSAPEYIMMSKIILTLILLFSLFTLKAQVSSMEDGIYLNIDEYKRNQPSILFENTLSIPNKLLSPKIITAVIDSDTIEILSRNIWAYVRDGMLYIKSYTKHDLTYSRALLTGSLIYYAEERARGSGYSSSGTPAYTINSKHAQYLIDTKTGDRYKYNVNNFELLIKDDPALLYEFTKLTKKKKKESLFLYLQKYNEKNPIQN